MKHSIALLMLALLISSLSNGAALAKPTTNSSRSLGRVAYVRAGDLWVQDLPSGSPRRLTHDGQTGSPRWSPSGTWLLLNKRDEAWVMRSDGSAAHGPSHVSKGVLPTWAPKEDRIAYLDEQNGLRVTDADGGGEKLLVRLDQATWVAGISWSHDGRWIAYASNLRRPPGTPQIALWRVPATGGRPERIHESSSRGVECLSLAGWTPDDEALLFWPIPSCSASVTADGLTLMKQPIRGGGPIKLVDVMLLHEDFLALGPKAAIAVVDGGNRETWTGKRIRVVDLHRGAGRYVTAAKTAAISPAWSPDFTHLAYIAMPDIGRVGGGPPAKAGLMRRKLWVVPASGEKAMQLTQDPRYRDEAPRWMADGKHLLFVRMDSEQRASLWLVDRVNPVPVQVADLVTLETWFGYYGYYGFASLFDYWAGPPFQARRDLATGYHRE